MFKRSKTMDFLLSELDISQRLRAAYHPGKFTTTDGYAEQITAQSGEALKTAAVLLPLTRHGDEWHLLFTRRTSSVETHKGQVSFPGGECDPGETSEQTALREAEEEIGLRAGDVRLLGCLNDVVTVTHFRVTPVAGVIPWQYKFRLSQNEVERVFSIPLSWLARGENWEEHPISLEGMQRAFPVITYHVYDGEILWGATARMTHNFLEILGLKK